MKQLAIFGRSREPVTYEVRLEIEPGIVSEFDDWLPGHAREMLAFPGFQSAEIFRAHDLTETHRVVRVAVYRIRSRRELDSYLRSHAKRMREEGVQKFGKQFSATRRILATRAHTLPEGLSMLYDELAISGGLPICGNCHESVEGRFCANCGQEDRTYLLSLTELIGDFFGELTNLDSRFFRSMKPLLFRPGWLTLEYMRGRRQHYFPPIRMYIIISLLFFFVTALLANSGLQNTQFNGDDIVTFDTDGDENRDAGRQRAIRDIEEQLETAEGVERQALQVALRSLRAREPETGMTPGEAEGAGTDTPADTPTSETESPAASDNDAEPAADETSDTATGDSAEPEEYEWTFPSIEMEDGKATASGWGSREIDARMARGMETIKKNPHAFVKTMIDNIPSMMLIFLPLIALILKVLYVFSRRYYVEHLMFSLHFHSAVFLLLLLWILFLELAEVWTALTVLRPWLTAAVWIYIPVYLYKSMRRVYGQGHWMTSFKFFLLFFSYIFAASITSALLFVAALYQQA